MAVQGERPNPLTTPLNLSQPAERPESLGLGRRRTRAELEAIGQTQRRRGQDAVHPFHWRGEWYYRAYSHITLENGKLHRVSGVSRDPHEAMERAKANRDRYLAKIGQLPATAVQKKTPPNYKGRTNAPLFVNTANKWLHYRRYSEHQYDNRPPTTDGTHNSYRLALENHILPIFGERPIDSIMRDELFEFRDTTLPNKRTKRGPLGSSQRRNIEGVLRQVFGYAYAVEKSITVDPARDLHITRKDKGETRRRNDEKLLHKKGYVPREIAAYLTPDVKLEDFRYYDKNRPETRQAAYDRYLHHTVYEARWVLSSLLAIRPAEVRGLTWDRITYLHSKDKKKRPMLIISQQLKKDASLDVKKHGTNLNIIKHTKTDAGYRSVPLPEPLVVALRRYQAIQNEWKKSPDWQPHAHLKNLVFTTPTGKPRRQQEDNAEWRDLLECVFFTEKDTENVRAMRLYDLRHIAITSWVRSGKSSIADIKQAAGHANISTTIDTYTHIDSEYIAPVIDETAEAMMETRNKRYATATRD